MAPVIYCVNESFLDVAIGVSILSLLVWYFNDKDSKKGN
jgi:hypothetical protein